MLPVLEFIEHRDRARFVVKRCGLFAFAFVHRPCEVAFDIPMELVVVVVHCLLLNFASQVHNRLVQLQVLLPLSFEPVLLSLQLVLFLSRQVSFYVLGFWAYTLATESLADYLLAGMGFVVLDRALGQSGLLFPTCLPLLLL